MAGFFDKIGSMLGFSDEKPAPDAEKKASSEQDIVNSARNGAVLELAKKTIAPEHLQKIETALIELGIPKENHPEALFALNKDGVMATKNADGKTVTFREFNAKLDTETSNSNNNFSVALAKDQNLTSQTAQSPTDKEQGIKRDSTPSANRDYVLEQTVDTLKKHGHAFGIDTSDEAHNKIMAADLINNRMLTKKDGSNLTIVEMDQAVNLSPKLKSALTEAFGEKATLASIIPTQKEKEEINKSINKAVKDNTGDIFEATIINIFKGLFSWIANNFKGDISDHIKMASADSIGNDVAQNLASSTLFDKEKIASIAKGVHTATVEQLGVNSAKQDTDKSNQSTQTAETADNKTSNVTVASAAGVGAVIATDAVSSNKANQGNTDSTVPPAGTNKTPPKSPTNDKREKPNKPQTATAVVQEQTTPDTVSSKAETKEKDEPKRQISKEESMKAVVAKVVEKLIPSDAKDRSNAVTNATTAITKLLIKNDDRIRNGQYKELATDVADALLNKNSKDESIQKTATALRAHAGDVSDADIKTGIDQVSIAGKIIVPKQTGLIETLEKELKANAKELKEAQKTAILSDKNNQFASLDLPKNLQRLAVASTDYGLKNPNGTGIGSGGLALS